MGNKSNFRLAIEGIVIEHMASGLKTDQDVRDALLPHVIVKTGLIPNISEQLLISDALDSIISELSDDGNSAISSPAVSSTTAGTMSSIFSVSCYINILTEQFSIMDIIFTKRI
jgi:hypothetical protein